MCGIIGYVGQQGHREVLLDGLERLEYRGYDSAGVALRDSDSVHLFRVKGRIASLRERMAGANFEARAGIGHTRWATHGAASVRNAHPHRTGGITLVHNGIIENFAELKKEITALGRVVKSDTDSEIVAHLFDIEILNNKTLEDAVKSVTARLRGAYAFVLMSDKDPDFLLGVRNGAPLLVGVGETGNYLASDVQAVLSHTKKIVYLEDKEFVLCGDKKITVKRYDGKEIVPVVNTLNWSADEIGRSGYPHYMLKEIHEQPMGLTRTLASNLKRAKKNLYLDGLKASDAELRTFNKVSIVACGTSWHAALVGKFYIERFAKLSVDVDYASEFRYREPVLDKQTLSLFISQSGETADTLAALREAKERHAHAAALVNVQGSSIARESDSVLMTQAGPEIGVASTKAFTTQLSVLYLLAIRLGRARGTLSPKEAETLLAELSELPFQMERVLELSPSIDKLTHTLLKSKLWLFMGRGIHYPVALEGALKLKEITYLHAEGYPAGEMKHGPIALIDRSSTTVVLSAPPEGETLLTQMREKVLSNLMEVKARGGKILAVGSEGDDELQGLSDAYLGIPNCSWGMSPLLLSIPMQLLAYYTAVHLGRDVDKPRNLAKSVTVE
ncbi:MAG: glutamine--fructose-6-phosphate transaminase (isomerizing) [Bdellovibrionaceae bacterium]|nr:glutamine--fructose-6-phosphate transaminase (isomerizing) [Bdellovibrionales bacterium]MCB9255113.1 glutamine--fructose-6-phosphate transaminase (isomerizing) [Pseudobdellovibrionaceae bacterium]